jgi:pimeloyl-ACP methyl ester carboxylesterase
MGREAVRVIEDRVVLDVAGLQELRERLARTRLSSFSDDGSSNDGSSNDGSSDAGSGGDGWDRGVPRGWLLDLLEDWRAFDFGALQDRLDGLTHLRADVDGQSLHLVRVAGAGPDPVPLLLTHGWPGSFLEYLPVLPLLSDPGAHGGNPGQAFTLVIPSLPGFGFSGPPPAQGLTGRAVAGLWHRLMTEGLGHDRYVAHGSDLGAGVTAWLARDHPDTVARVHLATPGLAAPPGPRSPDEDAFAAAAEAWTAEEGGYAHQHATKPGTLGAGLTDSPAGLAAWIGEKVVAWSSTRPDGSPAFDRDLLLATLTLYWVTGTITTSLMPYWAHRHGPGAGLPVDDPAPVPTAVTVFGGERVPFPKPPRALAERYYALSAWAEHPVGGHFPAVAEPDLLARALQQVLHR